MNKVAAGTGNKETKGSAFYHRFLLVISVLLCAALAVSAIVLVVETFYRQPDYDMLGGYRCKELSNVWFQTDLDGGRKVVDLPASLETDENSMAAVETVLPFVIDEGTYLSLESAAAEVSVYIDGTLRSKYDLSDSVWTKGYTPGAFLFVKLRKSDQAKKLRIETRSDTIYRGYVSRVFYGDQTGILLQYIRKHIAEIFFSFFLLILSAAVFLVSLSGKRRTDMDWNIYLLGLGMMLLSGWCITDCFLRQLIFARLDVVSFLSFVFQSLFPIPFLFYMNRVQKGRYYRTYLLLEGITLVSALAAMVLQLSGGFSYIAVLPILAAILAADMAAMLVSVFLDIQQKKAATYKIIAAGLFLFLTFGVLELLVSLRASSLMSKELILIGSFFFMMSAVMKAVSDADKYREERQEALTLSNSKTRFLASMSHEIRTPINTVLGMNEMIERECKDPNILNYADNIRNASQMLLSLVNDILDFSKIESGRIELAEVNYRITPLLHDVVSLLQERAAQKGLKLVLECDPDLPSAFLGDDVRIRQIITNLLTNAVKYTLKGSVTLSVSGEKTAPADQRNGRDYRLRIKVTDTGIGMKEETLDKIFLDFSRADDVRNRHIEGTGLELAITKLLVEAMEGTIQVKSVYQKGSEFVVSLPQTVTDPKPVGRTEEKTDQAKMKPGYQVSFTAPSAKVLVVDDNRMNRMVFTALLKKTKMQIDQASGGREALELCRKKKYDVIFMDHMMPDLDGIETLKILRSEQDNPNRQTSAVALTANAIAGIDRQYLEAGFQDYLAKPVQPAKLEKVVLQHLPEGLAETLEKPSEFRKESSPSIPRGKQSDSSEKQSDHSEKPSGSRNDLPEAVEKDTETGRKEGADHE